MSYIPLYLKYFQDIIIQDHPDDASAGLDYLRKLIFSRILAFMLPIGFIVLIPSLYMSLKTDLYVVAFADLVTYGIVVLACFNKSISVFIKMVLFAAALYIMALFLVFYLGINGPGFIYLLGISISLTLIINSKSGYISMLVNSIILFSYLAWQHLLVNKYGYPGDSGESAVIIINFLLVNAFAVFAIATLIEGLNKLLTENIALRNKAEDSKRLIAAFLQNISHEIRTPINGIIGFNGIIREKVADKQLEKYFNIIEENSFRLINTVSNILTASLIQQGQLHLNKEVFDLNMFLEESINSKRKQHERSNKQISFVYINQLREKDIKLHNDKERLGSVISELIDNAFRFSTEGIITLGCYIKERQLIIQIRDEGKGMTPSKLARIYEFFMQGDDSLTRGHDGLGLGLPNAKGILDQMGYKLKIRSTPGIGTSASISIPMENNKKHSQSREEHDLMSNSTQYSKFADRKKITQITQTHGKEELQ